MTTDGAGRFRLEGLEPGPVSLEFRHAARMTPTTHRVELVAGKQELRFDLDGTGIEGRIVDDAGRPLAGARVTFSRADSGAAGGRPTSNVIFDWGGARSTGRASSGGGVVTDEDGRYRLGGVEPEVALVVAASKEGFATARTASLQLAAGEVRSRVDLVLRAAGQLRILCDEPGPWLAEGRLEQDGVTRNEFHSGGQSIWRDVEAGEWTVTLRSASRPGVAASADLGPRTVVVHPGETAELRFTRD